MIENIIVYFISQIFKLNEQPETRK